MRISFGFWHLRMNILLKNQDHTFTGIDESIIAPATTPYWPHILHVILNWASDYICIPVSSCITHIPILNPRKSVSDFITGNNRQN
jgi:hypothetical protein